MAALEIVCECPKCYVVIPCLGCFHGCPGVEEDLPDEEGFQEDLDEWYQEIKEKMKAGTVRMVEAPEPSNLVELLPNQPGIQYGEMIYGPDNDGPYHVRRPGEVVPEGVVPLRMFQIGPGEFRKEEDVLREYAEIAEEFRQQQEEQRAGRPFREIFEELREPFP